LTGDGGHGDDFFRVGAERGKTREHGIRQIVFGGEEEDGGGGDGETRRQGDA
jgi:hypothetical protein